METLLVMFALPSPAAVLASLEGSTRYEELQHRWVRFPAVLPADNQLEQKLQQRKQALPSPRLMHLPDQFQVRYYKWLAENGNARTGTGIQTVHNATCCCCCCELLHALYACPVEVLKGSSLGTRMPESCDQRLSGKSLRLLP